MTCVLCRFFFFPIECFVICTFISLNESLFLIPQGMCLPPLGIPTIMITNCFVGSEKMQLAPVIISNLPLFQIFKCGSQTIHTFL